jgi:hypothetical protein
MIWWCIASFIMGANVGYMAAAILAMGKDDGSDHAAVQETFHGKRPP